MPIGRNYAEIRQRTLAAVDRVFAETVLLAPQKQGRADPDRQPIEIRAPLRVGGGEQTNVSGGQAESWRTQLASGKAELHIDRATYTGPILRGKDRVRALDRAGQPWFEVLRVDDRGDTRLVLELGEV